MPLGDKNQTMPGLGCHHIAVQTQDLEAALAFYTDVMGMRKAVDFEAGGRQIILLDIGDGSHMELFAPMPGTAPAGDASNDVVFHFALTTSDIAGALERVREAGMEITRELTTMMLGPHNVTIAFFTGPSGEVVELLQVND